jgi:hypothetical protein
MGEAVGAKTLHPTAFVVYANQRIWAHRLDVGTQGAELMAAFPIATKQNQASREGVCQAAAVGVAERSARNVQNQGSVGNGFHGSSSSLFNDDVAGGVVGFVAEGDMGAQSPLVEPIL